MQDALTAATNSLAMLDTQLRECSAIVAALDRSVTVGSSLHHSACMVSGVYHDSVCNISLLGIGLDPQVYYRWLADVFIRCI